MRFTFFALFEDTFQTWKATFSTMLPDVFFGCVFSTLAAVGFQQNDTFDANEGTRTSMKHVIMALFGGYHERPQRQKPTVEKLTRQHAVEELRREV